MTPARFQVWSNKASLDDFCIAEIVHWRTAATTFARPREFVTVRTRPGTLSKLTPWVLSPGRDCAPFDPLDVLDDGLLLRIDKRSRGYSGSSKGSKFSKLFVELIRSPSPLREDPLRACAMLQRIVCSQPGLPPTPFSLRVRDLHYFLRWTQEPTPYQHIKITRTSPSFLVRLVLFCFSHEVFVDPSVAAPHTQRFRDSIFSLRRERPQLEDADEGETSLLARSMTRDATGAFIIPHDLDRTGFESVKSFRMLSVAHLMFIDVWQPRGSPRSWPSCFCSSSSEYSPQRKVR